MDYTIQNKQITLTVSSRGAEPQRIQSIDGTDYLWTGSQDYWPGRGPHLFPFIGRLFESRYEYKGVSYPLSIHGFLRESELSVKEQGEDYISFELSSNEETLKQYPFEFVVYIHYKLVDSAVHISFEVVNKDDKTMLFAFGGHPGFNVPLDKGLSFEDYRLEFDRPATPKRAKTTQSVLISGEFVDYPLKDGNIIELRHDLFDDDAIILKDMAKSVTLKSEKGSRALRVDYPDFEYIGFWHTVKKDAPFICIEPWTGLPGCDGEVQDLEKHGDMIALEPASTYINEWVITIIV